MKAELDIVRMGMDIITESTPACEDPTTPESEGGNGPEVCGTGAMG